jgi:hypothetical protein
VMPGDDDGVGAEALGDGHRLGGVAAELAGFVRGGSHDPARTIVPDEDGEAGEGGVVENFDGGEEGVHIDVEDGAFGGGVGHRGIVAWLVKREMLN